ncbi:MAG: hypothetical protein K8U03_25020 [Planctomycetia bacterium]|nr:hypothetical protein [Planctomycetia bacterium]
MSRSVITCACILLCAATVSPLTALGAEPSGPPPKEGRIHNLDAKPFSFRLARRSGATWTEALILAPGETYTLRTDTADGLEGITGDGKGHVTIDYPELGGRIRLQLPVLNQTNQAYMPNWYHMRDSNGFSRLVQAESKEAAEARRKDLLAEPPLTPAELTAVKRTLRANFMLYDK